MQTRMSNSHTRLSWLLFPQRTFSPLECHQSHQVYIMNKNNTGFHSAIF